MSIALLDNARTVLIARVRAVGGIFYKSENPEALYAWYEKHLGIVARPGEGASFACGEDRTVWSIFSRCDKLFRSDADGNRIEL